MYFSETDRKWCSGRIEIADGDKRNQFEVSNLNSSNKALLSFSNPSPERATSWLRHQIRQSVSMVFLGGELQPSLRWNVSAIAVETDMNFLQINEPLVVVNQKGWEMYSFKRFLVLHGHAVSLWTFADMFRRLISGAEWIARSARADNSLNVERCPIRRCRLVFVELPVQVTSGAPCSQHFLWVLSGPF